MTNERIMKSAFMVRKDEIALIGIIIMASSVCLGTTAWPALEDTIRLIRSLGVTYLMEDLKSLTPSSLRES
jgi:hypothetical protein